MSDHEPSPVKGPEDDVIGYKCPACGTLKTTVAKAKAHCTDGTTDPADGPDTWLPDSVPDINSGVWSTLTEEMTSLMCTHPGNKNAFGPEGPENDPNAPCTDSTGDCAEEAETTADEGCHCDPRYRWTRTVNWMDFETARRWAETDPTLSDSIMAVLQREGEAYQEPADPGMLVDGDDVVDKHGTFHPEFLDVIHDLADGPGYVSLSTSDHGAHVPLIGKLPDGVKQLKIPLSMDVEGFDYSHVDEDEGDGLHIDIFDGKHLRKATGKHVEGTPKEPADIDSEALAEYCDEYGASLTTTVTDTDENGNTVEREVTLETEAEYTGPDPEEWDIPEDSCLEYHATVEAHYHGHSTGNFWRVTGAATAWGQRLGKTPTEILEDLHGKDRPGASAGYGGKTEGRVQYDWQRADNGAFEPPSRRTLAKMGILPARYATEDDSCGTPVSALPLAQLDALSPHERCRFARKRGIEWPSTDDARERLFQSITEGMMNKDTIVLDAPTALGKTYTCATTPWNASQYDETTGERPVIHLHKTKKARDQAIEASDNAGIDYFVLQSRTEACPVAAGEYDPQPESPEDFQPITMDGRPASEWLDYQCDEKGMPFSNAHQHLHEHNDQGVDLPCCEGDRECWSSRQYTALRDGLENDEFRLVHATHNFAFVPGLRAHTNLIIDEEPDFTQDLSTDRVRRAIGAYLRAIDAPVSTWEAFIQMSRGGSGGGDAGIEHDALQHALDQEPSREWYFEHDDAHILAPALARAIFSAEERANGRRAGKTPYEPPRLDANAHEDDGWNREWVSVVLDANNDIQSVRTAPDLSQARSVTGLDAHPALPKWQVNTAPYIERTQVLDTEERRLWRRYERGLRVVQVGDATRPLTSGEYFNETATQTIIEHLAEAYPEKFHTAITAASVEDELREVMQEAGIPTPETMHYGEEESRNDFAGEGIGFVNGCIDQGDEPILDLLAELDLDAEPERSESACEHCEGDGCFECDDTGKERAHGREFTGDDADTAAAILGSVRENHVAQSVGRYARNADNPRDTATVFARTNAMPVGFADVQVPGVVWTYSEKQEQIATALTDSQEQTTAREIAEQTDASKRHVQKTLAKWADKELVHAVPGAGPHGATLYRECGLPNSGVADIGGETANSDVWDTNYTWLFAVCTPSSSTSESPSSVSASADTGGSSSVGWDWQTADSGGGQK